LYYTIYKITNLLNGKIYIGQHKTKNLYDGYLGSGKTLNKALNKHGINNFKKEYLFVFDNFEEMNNKEKELVNEEFIKRKDTYNITLGGAYGYFVINPETNELDSIFNLTEFIENRKLNCIEKFGVSEPAWSLECAEKAKQTSLKRYGKEYYSQTEEYLERRRTTSLEKYGFTSHMMNSAVLQQRINTGLEKYGVEYYMQTEEAKQIASKKQIEIMSDPVKKKEILTKVKNTNLEKYGVDHIFKAEKFIEKRRETKKNNRQQKIKDDPNYHRILISNGLEYKRVDYDTEIPEGWFRGRTKENDVPIEKVYELREEYSKGGISQANLAKKHGVNLSQVKYIIYKSDKYKNI